MRGRHLYLSHPEVLIDPLVPVPQWGLSARGRGRAIAAAGLRFYRRVERIVSSDETKAIETATIFAESLGLGIEIGSGLHENDRSATGFLPPQEFEATADQFFREPGLSVRGWEKAATAQARIISSIASALAKTPDCPTLFVGHGGVGTLLWCHCAGKSIDRAYDQPRNGGGNIYQFDLDPPFVVHPWRPMDTPEESHDT